MPLISVEQFANELGVLPTVLLEQLRAAGVSKHLTGDSLTEKDKIQLLEYLRKIHGLRGEKCKINLPSRLKTSEIEKSGSTGKPRSIQVEVRKIRTISKKRSDSARGFPKTVTTQVAAIRLEEAFTSAAVGNGQCAGCSLTAPLKLVTTNHGLLALCAECLRKGLKHYKKWIVLQRPSLKKKKRRGRHFVRILQGGAPGLGKRSS